LHSVDENDRAQNRTIGINNNNIGSDTVNNHLNKRRTRNSLYSSTTATKTTTSSSALSFATDSGIQSATSSGWTSTGGLFSHIDINTSSTITAITDFSTVSRRSMFDLPDEKLGLSPPHCLQQSNCTVTSTVGESSASTSYLSTVAAIENTTTTSTCPSSTLEQKGKLLIVIGKKGEIVTGGNNSHL
jgi:hypothetical protein